MAISPLGPRLSSSPLSATRDAASLQGAGKDPAASGGGKMFQQDVFEAARPDRPQASRVPPPQQKGEAQPAGEGAGSGPGSGASGMMASFRAMMSELYEQIIEKLKRDFIKRMQEIMG